MLLVCSCNGMVSLPVLPTIINGTAEQKSAVFRSLETGLRREEK